jgi:phosphodiesterase/alkaline phosphatase D-like protein
MHTRGKSDGCPGSGSAVILILMLLSVLSSASGQTHFRFTANTGNNATVATPLTLNPNISGTPLAAGDEIGAFTPAGLCTGAIVWSDTNVALTVWGDDDQTPQIDGMAAGERIYYRVWQRSTNTEFASVNVTYLQGTGFYAANAIYILSSLSAVAPPGAPGLASPSNGATGQSTTVTLDWNTSPGAASYRVQVSTGATFQTYVLDDSTVTGTARQVTGLANGATYYWRVNASNSGGTSAWSSVWSFATAVSGPGAFSLTVPSNGAANQALTGTLSWQSSTGATGYDIFLDTSNPPTTNVSSNQAGTSYAYASLAAGTTYYWSVTAKNAGGSATATGAPWSFTTIVAAPAVPSLSSPANGATGQPTTVTLDWNASPGAASYRVQLSSGATFQSLLLDDSTLTGTSRQVTGLSNGTTYYWRVNAKNGGGTSAWSGAWNFTTSVSPPGAFSLTSPANGAANQAPTGTLSWQSSSGATGYDVFLDTSNPPTTNVSSNQAGTSYAYAALAAGTTYYWSVTAKNAGGSATATGAPWSFATIVAAPGAPVLSSPANGATGQPTTVTLDWNTSPGAASYRLQVSTSATFQSYVLDDSTLTGTSRQVTGLSNGTTYYWRVNAKNGGGTSPWSAVWNFTTSVSPPGAFSLSSPANGAANQALAGTLAWQSSSGATGYDVFLDTSNPPTTNVGSNQAGTSYAYAALAAGTTYYWSVTAKNAGGSATATGAPWSFTTVVGAPGAPVLSLPGNGATGQSTTVTLSWNSSSGAASYHVQVSTSATFQSYVLDDSTLTGTSRQVTGLSNGTTYYWRVDAKNGGGTSAWSAVWNFTTSDSPPGAFSLSSPANGAANQALAGTLAWQSSSGATGYDVFLGTSNPPTTNVSSNQSGTSYAYAALANGTTYYWSVTAKNAGGSTAATGAPWSFTTIVAAPAAPILSSPGNGATGQSMTLTLDWNPSPGGVRYRVQVSTLVTFAALLLDDSLITATARQVGPLADNTIYYWRVAAAGVGGWSDWSQTWGFATGVTSAVPPTLASPPDGATNQPLSPTLAWNASAGADSYDLQVSSTASFATIVENDTSLPVTSRAIGPLQRNTAYFWRVRTVVPGNRSAWSQIWSFTTIPPAPPPPALATPGNGSTGQPAVVTLEWNASPTATAYRLQLSQNQSFSPNMLDDSSLAFTSDRAGPLQNNVTCYWRVCAWNPGGWGNWSSVWQFTTASGVTPVPVATTGDTSGVGTTSAQFNGTVNANGVATTVKFQYGATQSYGYEIPAAQSPVTGSSAIPVSAVVTGLSPGASYHYRVVAQNDSGIAYGQDRYFTTRSPGYPSTLSLGATVQFPSHADRGSFTPADYRIVGLPGATNARADSILGGHSGVDWQLYWDNGSPSNFMRQFSAASPFRFSAGSAYWLIKNGPWSVSGTAPSVQLDNSGNAGIPLHAGWNLITNPFVIPVAWSAVQAANNAPDPIYAFNGSFNESPALQPYSGYYFFNAANLAVLKIPYPSGASIPASTVAAGENGGDWRVGIILSSPGVTDRSTRFGVSRGADRGLNRFDFRKPAGFSSGPLIFFDRPEWDSLYPRFATDIRPETGDLEEWRFEVLSTERERLGLVFSGLAGVPPDLSLVLIDETGAVSVDLRKDTAYNFIHTGGSMKFSVVAGKEEAVKARLESLRPGGFVLGDNYPNPFNPSTDISIGIPFESDIALGVFDLLGREVKVLYRGKITPGRHTFSWDGRDRSGNSLPSGTYFSRLIANGGLWITRKMLLLR